MGHALTHNNLFMDFPIGHTMCACQKVVEMSSLHKLHTVHVSFRINRYTSINFQLQYQLRIYCGVVDTQ